SVPRVRSGRGPSGPRGLDAKEVPNALDHHDHPVRAVAHRDGVELHDGWVDPPVAADRRHHVLDPDYPGTAPGLITADAGQRAKGRAAPSSCLADPVW